DHPVMRRGLAGLDRFTITEDTSDGPVRRMEACQSPVWDTVLAMIALADAGLPADHPALAKAADWLLAEDITGPRDWQARRPAGRGTGRRAGQSCPPAAGRSSSTTPTPPTSTTPPRSSSRCAGPGPRPGTWPGRPPSAAGWPGSPGWRRRTAAGPPSTPTTPRR